jgi:hypothetical protein
VRVALLRRVPVGMALDCVVYRPKVGRSQHSLVSISHNFCRTITGQQNALLEAAGSYYRLRLVALDSPFPARCNNFSALSQQQFLIPHLLKHPVLVLRLAFALVAAARVFSFFSSVGLADRSISGSSFSGDGDIVLYSPSVMISEA